MTPTLKRSLQVLSVFLCLYTFLLSITLMGASFQLFGAGFAEELIRTCSNPFVGLFILPNPRASAPTRRRNYVWTVVPIRRCRTRAATRATYVQVAQERDIHYPAPRALPGLRL